MRKYSTRGGSEWQSRVLYLPRDPTPSAVFSLSTRVYGDFTGLLVLRGRIISVFRGEEKALGKVGLLRCMLLKYILSI